MSKANTNSDELHSRLEDTARKCGYASLEQLLEAWQADAEERERRRKVAEQIHELRECLVAKYGKMRDSVELIRDDRER